MSITELGFSDLSYLHQQPRMLTSRFWLVTVWGSPVVGKTEFSTALPTAAQWVGK